MKCGAHALDLLLKDISKLPWCADIIKRNLDVVKWVKNHHATSAILLDKTQLRLINPCATRFATNLLSCMRTLKVRCCVLSSCYVSCVFVELW